MSGYRRHQELLVHVIVVTLFSSVALHGTFSHAATDKAKPQMDAIALAEQLVIVDDGCQGITVDNSHICVITTASSRIISNGISVVPVVLEVMRNESTSFDLFVRCYSVCDQLLAPKLSGQNVWWTGGCKTRETKIGIVRFDVSGQLDIKEFRKRVILDIEKKYAQVFQK